MTEQARAAAGVRGVTVPLWTPGDWLPLEFPLDQPDAALAFITGAFRHGGWPLLDDFAVDLAGAYRGLRPSLRATVASGEMMRVAAVQMRVAIQRLRPRVVEVLQNIEQAAVEELRGRLAAAITAATYQARSLLAMPVNGGKALDPESLLAMRVNSPRALKRAPPTIRSSAADGAYLRSQIRALLPDASRLAEWDQTKELQEALQAVEKVLAALAMVHPQTRPLLAVAQGAEAAISAARTSAGPMDELQGVLTRHEDVLQAWRAAHAGFAVARRAAADRLPVLHRFSFSDVVEAATEDDGALGWRVSGILANVFFGAIEVRERYVTGVPALSRKPAKRPAQRLAEAMKSPTPPSDPVGYLMEQASGSVWAHDGLIQATLGTMSQSTAHGGPFALLESFQAAVSEQALAEGARQRSRGVLVEVGKGLGLGAGLVLLHIFAPPLALVIDAGFAAHDLTVASTDLAQQTAESRCAFDQALTLGPEPSLAWFLATQAFNILTVG